MKNKKTDRRSRRTQKLLIDALLELMQQKSYDEITVQDIIDRANTGRSTFYAHYLDKEDLLEDGLDEIARSIDHSELADGRHLLPTRQLFRHIYEHQALFRALVWGGGIDLLYKTLNGFLSKNLESHLSSMFSGDEKPPLQVSLLATYISGSLFTLIRWWLENKTIFTPEQMDETFQQLVMPGVLAVLGSDLKPPTTSPFELHL